MNEQLPITIGPSEALNAQLPGLTATVNKLEAQLNFQALTAGWYGDEENILQTRLSLVTSGEFSAMQQQKQAGERYDFADDVLSYHRSESRQVCCIVALTDNELALFSQRKGLVAAYLRTKLHKVLNLIAAEEDLSPF
ncbi:hypothetical protein SG34_015405 [Thalassomonas viridans]|uniref:Uncharacterized protein n=1 Tax=Thalassomonas viridans TaxID=137584 RepID=A0AAE9YWZ8_9GAMM|nr:hypothetical protein [Thalassomonas viridans]WDE02831.1 hypothetical protein SG34_015405 [Thalassomonas viridans]